MKIEGSDSEIWVDIIGYVGKYQVSNKGNVRALAFNNGNKVRLLKPSKTGKDRKYLTVSLYNNGVRKHFKVHRLVAEAFLVNTDNKPQVNHINGNTFDNSLENLEWATNSENQLHAWKTGLQNRVCSEAKLIGIHKAWRTRWGYI